MCYSQISQILYKKTGVCEAGLGDCHKMVFTIFCSTFVVIKTKLLKGQIFKSEDPYSKLTEIFQEILQKHAPLKSKQVRGNYAPFMNKELRKVIVNKSRLRNKYLKWPF